MRVTGTSGGLEERRANDRGNLAGTGPARRQKFMHEYAQELSPATWYLRKGGRMRKVQWDAWKAVGGFVG